MRTVRVLCTSAVAALALPGCSSIYLHDAELKTSATKAHDALAGVTPLKPFDDQLANLSEFALREDRAVADYWASVRDKHVMGLVALPDARRDAQIRHYASRRLDELLGPGQATPANLNALMGMVGVREIALEHHDSFERRAASYRRIYLDRWQAKQKPDADGKQPKAPDLSCKKLLTLSAAEKQQLEVQVEPQGLIAAIDAECSGAKTSQDKADAVTATLMGFADGHLGQVAKEAADYDAATKDRLSDHSIRLEAIIKRAGEYKGAADGLERLRKDVQGVLEGASEATKLAGWEELDTELSELLRTAICNAPEKAVKEETRKEARCNEIVPQSGPGRASAVWGTLKALAQLQDANAADRRSANWLLAAKAIVGAEKANSKLKLEAAKAKASASRQRLDVLVLEGANLASAIRWLQHSGAGQSESLDCVAGLNSRNRQANRSCSYAAYVTAWNSGRMASEVLRYRPIQIDREYAVRRARAIAEKQFALATAGTGTLKQYGEGGLMPETIARAAFDVVSAGIVSSGD